METFIKLIDNSHFNLVFTGWGASTCILMIEMEKKSLLKNKKILIIEPSDKLENDKTFCFWAEKNDDIYQNFKSIISNSWTSIQINDNKSSLIDPVEYFHVDSKDLYDWTRNIIKKYNIEHRREKVDSIEQHSKIKITTSDNKYFSEWVFDSRPPNFKNLIDNQFNISQSFFGLKVNFNEKDLNPDVYHMMDFRVSQKKATQFVYILPYSKHSALVELTRFGKELLKEEGELRIGSASWTPLEDARSMISKKHWERLNFVGTEFEKANFIYSNYYYEVNTNYNKKYEIPQNFSLYKTLIINGTRIYSIYKKNI